MKLRIFKKHYFACVSFYYMACYHMKNVCGSIVSIHMPFLIVPENSMLPVPLRTDM